LILRGLGRKGKQLSPSAHINGRPEICQAARKENEDGAGRAKWVLLEVGYERLQALVSSS
jgi:hypothetical protein